jgi:hypothetical protein
MQSQQSDSDGPDTGWKGLMAAIVLVMAVVTLCAAGGAYVWEHAVKDVVFTAATATNQQVERASRPQF